MSFDWATFQSAHEAVRASIQKSSSINVNRASIKESVKGLVRSYFNEARPELQRQGVDSSLLASVDEQMQRLLRLTQGNNPRKAYLGELRRLRGAANAVEMELALVRNTRGATEAAWE